MAFGSFWAARIDRMPRKLSHAARCDDNGHTVKHGSARLRRRVLDRGRITEGLAELVDTTPPADWLACDRCLAYNAWLRRGHPPIDPRTRRGMFCFLHR